MSQIPQMPPPGPPDGVMPLQPLTYETRTQAPRPGILTAVGVLSIILACLSVIVNCGAVVNGVVFGTLRNLRIPTPPTPSQMTTPPPAANHSSLSDAQRQIVVAALDRVHAITPARREMLDRLLMEAGDDMFPFAAERFSDERITASVSDSGDLPPETPGERGNLYFVLGNGRIELADDHATFSASGGGQRVRVNRDEEGENAQVHDTVVPPFGGSSTTSFTVTATPFGGISHGTAMLSLIDGVLGMLLAIFLFIAGVVVLMDSSKGRAMHLTYASVKIPLALLGAVTSWLFYTQIMKSFAATTGGSPRTFRAAMGVSSAFSAAFACLYPLALFIVMNLQLIKNYYIERRTQGG